MVGDSPDVEQVILGPGGVLEGARPGMIVIDMTTISPEVTRRIAAGCGEKGVHMLDAPVSGGEKGAIEATLSIMVGGEQEVYDRCRPLFEILGKRSVMGSAWARRSNCVIRWSADLTSWLRRAYAWP